MKTACQPASHSQMFFTNDKVFSRLYLPWSEGKLKSEWQSKVVKPNFPVVQWSSGLSKRTFPAVRSRRAVMMRW